MPTTPKVHRALSLISGGLDSLLATKVILEQGISVTGINFFTGFTGDHDYYIKRLHDGCHSAKWVCDQLGIKLHIIDVVADFKSILHAPKYGYGANLNPCLDCKLFMIVQAKQWMEQHGFDFLITGEVLGQRPKSQRKDTLPLATKITADLIVRPLSAKLLPATLPERKGWIKRELLHKFSGRGRNQQINLAHHYGFKELPQPGGGCLLTDANFCKRLQDLWDHSPKNDYTLDDILLLRLGRHLRIKPSLKVIIGRDEVENNFLQKLIISHTVLQPIDYPGAVVLLDGKASEEDLILIAKLAAYYSKGRGLNGVRVLIRVPLIGEKVVTVLSLTEKEVKQFS